MSASGKLAKSPHFPRFVPTHFRTPSFRAWKSCGLLTQGVARRLALPWAIIFRAFSPVIASDAHLTPLNILIQSPAMNLGQQSTLLPLRKVDKQLLLNRSENGILKLQGMLPVLTGLLLSLFLTGYPSHARGQGSNSGVFHRHGQLQVVKGQLCDQSGAPVQLKGMSSHDLKQFPFATNTLSQLVNDWHVSVVRAAMYTDSYGSSYIREPQVKQAVKLIVDAALRSDVYVLVDWHILEDGNPNRYRQQAKEFFEEIARDYGGHPNVIYEICNEPNGPAATWKEIKSYAEFIIPAIRAVDPDSVIIVGTDTWCQGLRAAANDPLSFTNILYALHFYAGTHRA